MQNILATETDSCPRTQSTFVHSCRFSFAATCSVACRKILLILFSRYKRKAFNVQVATICACNINKHMTE